jgi:hypothetical protein
VLAKLLSWVSASGGCPAEPMLHPRPAPARLSGAACGALPADALPRAHPASQSDRGQRRWPRGAACGARGAGRADSRLSPARDRAWPPAAPQALLTPCLLDPRLPYMLAGDKLDRHVAGIFWPLQRCMDLLGIATEPGQRGSGCGGAVGEAGWKGAGCSCTPRPDNLHIKQLSIYRTNGRVGLGLDLGLDATALHSAGLLSQSVALCCHGCGCAGSWQIREAAAHALGALAAAVQVGAAGPALPSPRRRPRGY